MCGSPLDGAEGEGGQATPELLALPPRRGGGSVCRCSLDATSPCSGVWVLEPGLGFLLVAAGQATPVAILGCPGTAVIRVSGWRLRPNNAAL